MYDELARSQKRTPLEWVFLNAVLPSLVLTALLPAFQPTQCDAPRVRLQERISYDLLPVVTPGLRRLSPGLVSIRRPVYPADMRQAARDGRVVLKAVVDERGRVHRSSIQVLQTTDARFDDAARRALGSAVFWPAAWRGGNVGASVTMAIEFNLYRELTSIRGGTGRAR